MTEETVAEELPGEELEEEPSESDHGSSEARRLATVDTRFRFEDAGELGRRRGVRVVVLAGEPKTGKTTLLVELWERLLADGVVGDVRFAGSRSALGFERRAWLSRVDSGVEVSDTERTFLATSGWLHLRLVDQADAFHELMLSDLSGETFERLRKGDPLLQVLPDSPRFDRLVVIVDAEAVSTSARRQLALSSARRIVESLRSATGLHTGLRIAVVLTKADHLSEAARPLWESARDDLLKRARAVDSRATFFETAARPDGDSDAVGLARFAHFLVEEDETIEPRQAEIDASKRTIGRL